ncbi:MAG: peptidoglycan editing factor PgeF [Alphaproteobacteria bacterium]|nr:peptidoglycan editing factor PgeF [Alphaproteobacteria bacterium]
MSEILRADNLEGLSGVRHGFFTSAWGNCGLSEKYDPAELGENRRRVAESLSVKPANLLSCYQIHSPDVVTIARPWAANERPQADAMVTKEKGIALGILTADCAPLLLVDRKAGVIGAAHAGWRGALTGVIENTVAAMEKLGANRTSMRAAIGPCIWQNSYEVGPEFPAPFLAENPEHEKFFRPAFKSGHYMFNLPGYAEAKLKALNLDSIESSPADTCADEEQFFSYRRDCLRGGGRSGSLISVIVLAD